MRRKLLSAICFIAIAALVMGGVIIAAPGTDEDPLITYSYIQEKLVPQVQQYIDARIEELVSVGDAGQAGTGYDKFKVVSVKAGGSFIGGEGTEFIIRQGSGKIISTPKGGIVNTAAAVDLPDGAELPVNSLLIVPLGDGRGFEASVDVLVMVKGTYIIQ